MAIGQLVSERNICPCILQKVFWNRCRQVLGLVHSTFINCFQWAGPVESLGIKWPKWPLISFHPTLLPGWTLWPWSPILGLERFCDREHNLFRVLVILLCPCVSEFRKCFVGVCMRYNVFGFREDKEGRGLFQCCYLISIRTATSHQSLSFPSVLGLLGSTSRDMYCSWQGTWISNYQIPDLIAITWTPRQWIFGKECN